MDELISRQAAIKAVVNGLSIKPYETVVREIIEAIPAADIRKHGKWIVSKMSAFDVNDFVVRYWNCSECKGLTEGITRYCPNCGARMDGEEE